MINSVQMSPYTQRQNPSFGKLSAQQVKQGVVKFVNEGNPNNDSHWFKRISRTVVREGIALSPLFIPANTFKESLALSLMAFCLKGHKDLAGATRFEKRVMLHHSELNTLVDGTIANKTIKGIWNGITKTVKAIVSCL